MKRLVLVSTLFFWMTNTYGQKVFEKDFTRPEATEIWKPVPKIVTPGSGNAPPSDAIVLFDGTNLDAWVMAKDGTAAAWHLKDGVMTVNRDVGDIQTVQKFGDAQIHIEFQLPVDAKNSANPGNSGNSGVFVQERYEVQIFDSYQNSTPLYSNGQIGSLYKQAIPMANASSKTGEWNTFDIYYSAPRFRDNGTVEQPAYITVVHNGVLTLHHFEIQGTIKYIGIPQYEPHGNASLRLQGHGSEVSFRNIWIREL